ncbi:MAG: hypothetical protein HYX68_04590 [Planctomycetes bacterium]|nr:hypothetical protein [Planctomycetota bacterium]
MLAELDVPDYLKEIREQVCSRCVERPLGGPPCAPLGKQCGVELHLRQLIESIHEVDSGSMMPYLEHNRAGICEHCAFLHSSICPCPMDYLSALIVEAVECVDRRRERRAHVTQLIDSLSEQSDVGLEEIDDVYEEATGTWTLCDWPTHFGPDGLNLQGMVSSQAKGIAVESAGTQRAETWSRAACWLAEVERFAAKAECEAALAVAAAKAGEWRQALLHARRAWAYEFATGRPLRNQRPRTWLNLTLVIDKVARANAPVMDEGGGD